MKKVVEAEEGFCIEVKRFGIPVEIKSKCPNCGNEITFGGGHEYMSYPVIGENETIAAFCEECDDYCYIDVKLKMSMEFDDEKVRFGFE